MYYKSQNYSNMKIFIICAFVLHRKTHAELKLSMLSCYELTVCIVVNGKKISCRDLNLDQTIPNVELIRDIFIYYNIFKFQNQLFFELSFLHTQTHTHTNTHTHR